MNFRNFDLNLLRTLVALYNTRSVTRAADLLALSQPATSNALGRLRDFFDDALFVRSPTGLVPTRLCNQMLPQVMTQLQILEGLIQQSESFSPLAHKGQWNLSLSDLGECYFLPKLTRVLREKAPLTYLSNTSVVADDIIHGLEERRIDCAIGILPLSQRNIKSQVLFRGHYVLISALDWQPLISHHPDLLQLSQLQQNHFMMANPSATLHNQMGEVLRAAKLRDQVILHTRHYAALPALIEETDLLAFVPLEYAMAVVKRYAIKMWHFEQAPSYDVQLIWHTSTDKDLAQQWLRELVCELFTRTKPEKTP